MNPENYVESGILMAHNYEAPGRRNTGHLFNTIVANRDRSNFLWRQDRVMYEGDISANDENLRRTPPCKAIFRHHCETDINEIYRIKNIMVAKKRLDDIDLQAVNCIYGGHTVFSIFNDYDKMMEQVLTQLDEGEWENEV